jgi:hypothetical protein
MIVPPVQRLVAIQSHKSVETLALQLGEQLVGLEPRAVQYHNILYLLYVLLLSELHTVFVGEEVAGRGGAEACQRSASGIEHLELHLFTQEADGSNGAFGKFL